MDLFSTADEQLQRVIAVALGGIGGEDSRRVLKQMSTNAELPQSVLRTVRMAVQRLDREAADETRLPPAGSTLGGRGDADDSVDRPK